MSGQSKRPSSGLRASSALEMLRSDPAIETVLDIGSGAGLHARAFVEADKTVTAVDLGRSRYFRQASDAQPFETIVGDLFEADLPTVDLVWCSHVLEHLPDVGRALERFRSLLLPGGRLAVTVPPLKPEVVGGHLSLWTLGLLAYRLIVAGFDCSEATFLSEEYDLSAIVSIDASVPADVLAGLECDSGDVSRLAAYFPRSWKAHEGFRGDLPDCRISAW